MPLIHEEVTIKAPPERVWKTVQEDLADAPKWAGYIKSARVVKGRKPGPGSRIRYELDVGAWQGALELQPEVWEPPRRSAGRLVEGPLSGTWSYEYRPQRGATRMAYEMDYQLTGPLRFFGGMLKGQYEAGIRESMKRLKEYVESREKDAK